MLARIPLKHVSPNTTLNRICSRIPKPNSKTSWTPARDDFRGRVKRGGALAARGGGKWDGAATRDDSEGVKSAWQRSYRGVGDAWRGTRPCLAELESGARIRVKTSSRSAINDPRSVDYLFRIIPPSFSFFSFFLSSRTNVRESR